MGFRLLGAASAPPSFSLDQAATAEFAAPRCCNSGDQERLLSVLYRRTRIRKRVSVLLEETGGRTSDDFFGLPSGPSDAGPTTRARMEKYEKFAGEMAVRACRKALDRAGMKPSEVSHLITVSCTGFYAPGIDFDVITRLDLNPAVERVQVGFMGCQATLNALRVARAFTEARPGTKILIASVELCSLHFQYGWDPDRVVSNSLFADGAGALVGTFSEPGVSPPRYWTSVANGSYLVPDSADSMTWRIGDHGFQMTLSAQVPDLIERYLAQWVDGWLGSNGLSLSDIRGWAIHPGGPRILTATERALGLSREATAVSREVLAHNGNMSSATMVFLLERLMEQESRLPCVALGFGPGLTIEAALFV